MTLTGLIKQTPIAFDPSRGQDALGSYDPVDPTARALICGAAGSSPYLAGLIAGHAAWLDQAFADPQAAILGEMAACHAATAGDLPRVLRKAKGRIALTLALADLSGAWPLERITQTLTDFADCALSSAMAVELEAQRRRGKLSMVDGVPSAGMVALAMGKMGAYELNYSSDIDIICLFDDSQVDPADVYDLRSALIKVTRAVVKTLNDVTADGYVFRTDLRLRPDPSVTPVCMAMSAAETYYESLGRTWERAAFIKARPAAGDLNAGARFLQGLTPFVWRKHLDFAAIQDAYDMQSRIRDHKGLAGGIQLPGHDMKLGRGGIREIEFFAQTRQLIAGGRDPDLRQRETQKALLVLAQKGWISDDMAQTLCDHYRAHRMVEHRIQMIHDAQTHKIPMNDDGLARLACLNGQSVEEFTKSVLPRLQQVEQITQAFYEPSKPKSSGPELASLAENATDIMGRWRSYPALRSERALMLFQRLEPVIAQKLSSAAKPDEALLAFDGFLAGLPAGVQLFALLDANPQLIDLLVDILGTAPDLAGHLSKNAGVFDAVIGGSFFGDWPGVDGLRDAAAQIMGSAPDYEAKLDALRRWQKEWHFRIGVHLLRGIITPVQASGQYADLAQSTIAALWPIVGAEFTRKHGAAPGQGACVVGMGSLGAGQLNARSDLDLIVIYDADGVDDSDGPRPLPARSYYARLTQSLITAISAPMAQGRLYEIDMRLRPSGNKGPVATSIGSFESYQRGDAWTWEHLALSRARPIAGSADLMQQTIKMIDDILAAPRQAQQIWLDVQDMRDRLFAAKPHQSQLDGKNGPGRLQDIELFAQGALLQIKQGCGSTHDGLNVAAEKGLISVEQSNTLRETAQIWQNLRVATCLLSSTPLDLGDLGRMGGRFLRDALGVTDLSFLASELNAKADAAAQIINEAIKRAK